MPKIFIHIGPPKTGSSALQTFFTKNISVLREKGFLYPEIGGSEYSSLKNAYSELPTPGNAFPLIEKFFSNGSIQDNSMTGNRLRLFKEYLEEHKEYNIILSSEYFSEDRIPNEALETIYDTFRVTHEPKIIIYLRRQDYWVQSRYAHAIRIPEIMETEKLDGPCLQRYIKKCTLRPLLKHMPLYLALIISMCVVMKKNNTMAAIFSLTCCMFWDWMQPMEDMFFQRNQ